MDIMKRGVAARVSDDYMNFLFFPVANFAETHKMVGMCYFYVRFLLDCLFLCNFFYICVSFVIVDKCLFISFFPSILIK